MNIHHLVRAPTLETSENNKCPWTFIRHLRVLCKVLEKVPKSLTSSCLKKKQLHTKLLTNWLFQTHLHTHTHKHIQHNITTKELYIKLPEKIRKLDAKPFNDYLFHAHLQTHTHKHTNITCNLTNNELYITLPERNTDFMLRPLSIKCFIIPPKCICKYTNLHFNVLVLK